MYMSSIIFKKKWEQSKSSHTLFHRILSLSLHGEPRPASQLVLVLVLVLIFVPFLHWLTVTRSWCQTFLHFIPDFLPCQLLICGHLCCQGLFQLPEGQLAYFPLVKDWQDLIVVCCTSKGCRGSDEDPLMSWTAPRQCLQPRFALWPCSTQVLRPKLAEDRWQGNKWCT